MARRGGPRGGGGVVVAVAVMVAREQVYKASGSRSTK